MDVRERCRQQQPYEDLEVESSLDAKRLRVGVRNLQLKNRKRIVPSFRATHNERRDPRAPARPGSLPLRCARCDAHYTRIAVQAVFECSVLAVVRAFQCACTGTVTPRRNSTRRTSGALAALEARAKRLTPVATQLNFRNCEQTWDLRNDHRVTGLLRTSRIFCMTTATRTSAIPM